MAPVGQRIGNGEQNNGEEGQQNLWYSILGEVSTHSSSKLPANKSILVLGDDESGKTSMVARLQGNEDPKKGSGLEYTYLDVRDEDRDDIARCGVWLLDGDDDHSRLLQFALTADNIEDTLVILVVDMSQPWNVKASLDKWSRALSVHISRLNIAPQKMRDLEQKLIQQFQTYVEPDSTQETSGKKSTTVVTPNEEEQVLLPLGETTLTHNLGVPVIVVCTKSDAVSSLEKDFDYKIEHFDYIQQFIRKFCLNYGAALFYISVKEEKNCGLLKKYLLHRIYNFPFNTPPLVVEKEALFIPLGWDTLKKISICYENMMNIKPDDPFEDVLIKPPVSRKGIQDCRETVAEDEQLFLMRQQNMLSKNISQGKAAESPQRPSKTSASPAAVTPGSASKAKIDPSKAGGTPNEGVLANFFNSLLSKKTGTGSPQSKAGDKAVRSDAKAELDRMTKGKPVPSQASSTGSAS
ncbi:cytoplasmic dynein 1 light intermediate chain 2-like [Anneissia japonica]|uniref:cytoplasmic dynein 1 light intermediate chain 2-like n=1 Tax=Anneissia japonica TaxID=1529436 RepID=UPI0014257912|nr:cytoplasmic dynein 1 light intermediate chain 2-like [Anneissia japonica]